MGLLDLLNNASEGNNNNQKTENNNNNINRGIVFEQTKLFFKLSKDTLIQIKDKRDFSSSVILNSSNTLGSNTIIQPNFKFEDIGIGGLDKEFTAIFRRAFASRIFPPSLVHRIGIQHVKGILLYGPPGTGKTLIARQIGKMLNCETPKIVNGPEILNKFVGQSEENIRKLFYEAEIEYKEKGEDSSLHIIIFDELDAICKQRGSAASSTGVGDSVVNQLLSKIDGVDQLNNVLIIGMTNRLDMIDEALLRPGRLEVHMEIGLPDENGRLQILKIHTAKMRESNILDKRVNLKEIARLTKNFSGAEIGGLVKSASSFAFNRHIKQGTLAEIKKEDIENLKVQKEDFENAMEEVKPAFGISGDEIQQLKILESGQLYIEQVKNSDRTPLVSIILHGEHSSGKSALAATIALNSEFPYIKLISPETMVGYNEAAKLNYITKVFNDSYRSPLSVVLIDNLERLIDWVDIGPRFSNTILQTLMVLVKKRPPKNKRLIVLATSSNNRVIKELGLFSAFDAEIKVPQISNYNELEFVFSKLDTFNKKEIHEILNLLEECKITELKIGIKKLIMYAEMATQSQDKIGTFIMNLQENNPGNNNYNNESFY